MVLRCLYACNQSPNGGVAYMQGFDNWDPSGVVFSALCFVNFNPPKINLQPPNPEYKQFGNWSHS